MEESASPAPTDDVNGIVRDLQALRVSAGGVSYAEIVRRVTALRLAAGVAEFLARPARTTVYDAFREGRARLDADLVADIAEALGGDGPAFRQRCLSARIAAETTAREPAPEPPGAPPEPTPEAIPAAGAHPSSRHRLALATACVALNLVGYLTVDLLNLPLFLDMTGTGIAAIALGPWHGVLVALATHLLALSVHGSLTVPFAIVNIAGALIWGYGVRRFGFGTSLPRFAGLTLVVAVACSALATPILLLLFGGDTGHTGRLIETLVDRGGPFWVAVLVVNLIMSTSDKLISGFLTLIAVAQLGRRFTIPGGALFHALSQDPSAAHSATVTAVRADRAPEPQ